MFEAVISDLLAEQDIVHKKMTSPWYRCNDLWVIACGWIVELNGNATFNFCLRVVDMISGENQYFPFSDYLSSDFLYRV